MDRGYSKYINSLLKRCFDIVLCLILLPLALPAMLLIALVVLVCDGRPVIFKHRRAGKGGNIFLMPKFRTLCNGTDPYAPSPEAEDDPRITVTGRFLRRHKLDELPQLFSVIKGHMTLVGPRPEFPEVVDKYESFHRKRLLLKPGVTGLWQLFGNHQIPIHKDMKYDLYYLHTANLWLDMKIAVITFVFMMNPRLVRHLQVKVPL